MPIIYPQSITVLQVISPLNYSGQGNNEISRLFDAIDGSYCTPAQREDSASGGKPQCGLFKPTNIITFSYGSGEYFSTSRSLRRQCNEYLKLGLKGVTMFASSGDSGVGGLGRTPATRNGSNCSANDNGARLFSPDFPATCE